MRIKNSLVFVLSRLGFLTSLAIRLTNITGKSEIATHPKHLIELEKPWYLKYVSRRDKVLDIGCGTGNASIKTSSKAKFVVGLDNNEKNIETAKKISQNKKVNNINFKVFDANRKLPFKDKSFEIVFMFDVLEHLEKRENILKEIRRVLKNNGKLLLAVDNPDTSWKKAKKEAGLFYYADRDHKYEYPKEEIIKLLEKNKFKILTVNPITLDTPLKPLIDLIGGFSLSLYKKLSNLRIKKAYIDVNNSTGYRIAAQKI